MNYLTLDLDNGDLVLSDNSVWKSLNTWLDGGTLYSDYYDASNCGDFWIASSHWISIDSESTYLTFTIEYEFIDASATDSCLCQIKFDGFEDGGVAVTADSSGLNISTDASKHINCDYSNANIKIDITANLLTKEITTYIHKDNEPLAKKVNVFNYSFTEFVIQAGSRGDIVYKLPTTTKLLNVSVSDVAVSYSNFPETIDYIDKLGLARIWANIKSYISSQLLGKSDTGHTHVSSDVTDLLSDTHTWTSQQSYNSDLNLNYASTDVDDIVNSVAGSATLDNFVHMTGNETVNGIKSFPDGVIANVTGSATSATNDGSGNVISSTYGSLTGNNTWSGDNTFTKTLYLTNSTMLTGKRTDLGLGELPASDKSLVGIVFRDKNDDNFCYLRQIYTTTGENSFQVFVRNKFTSNAPSTSGTIDYAYFGLGLNPDGSQFGKLKGNFIPVATNSYDLGSSSYQWKSVYAQTYYYNGTAWGLDKANTWTTDQIIQNARLVLKNTNISQGSSATTGGSAITLIDKNNQNLVSISTRVTSASRTIIELNVRNTYKNGALSNDQGAELIASSWYFGHLWNGTPYYTLTGYCDSDIIPKDNNSKNLGTSTNKWKTLNGVNPGALSFPNGNAQDSSWIGDLTVKDGSGYNLKTFTLNGWITINIPNTAGNLVFVNNGCGQVASNEAKGVTGGNCAVFIPVVANVQVSILLVLQTGESVLNAIFSPCLGNV